MTARKVYALCNFKNHHSEYVAPRIEEKLRDEIGATLPLSYQLEGNQTAHVTVGTVIDDAVRMLARSSGNTLFTLYFEVEHPRSFQFQVQVTRGGVGSFIGGLLYSAQLTKSTPGEISLEKPRTFGNSKFTGNNQLSEKLNYQTELIKQANKFSRTRIGYSGIIVQIPRFFKLVPNERGTLLVINTLPKTSLTNCLLGIKDFLELVGQLEAAL